MPEQESMTEKEQVKINRVMFRPYDEIDFAGLALAWQLIPEIHDEFPDVWTFVCTIAALFPKSPVKNMANKYILLVAKQVGQKKEKT